jgi:hypothetical protein
VNTEIIAHYKHDLSSILKGAVGSKNILVRKKKKKNSTGGERPPPRHCTMKEILAKLAENTPKPRLHLIGLHRNLGRPRPTMLVTTATTPGRRAQTNHRCHRSASCHYFLCCNEGLFCCHQDLNPGWCLP